MNDTIQLPKDAKSVARVIDHHMEREMSRLSVRRTMWLMAWHYLNGARRFDIFDVQGQRVSAHHLDEEGNLEFQSQELLSQINRVSGMLASRNLGPKVEHEGMSLQGIRERAIAQIMLDSVVSDNQLERVKSEFAEIFVALGSCGITGHLVDHPTIGLTSDLEVVHPKELFPFPSLGTDHTKAQGLVRQRVVPMTFLEEKFGKSKVRSNKKNMEWWEIQAGEQLGDYGFDRDVDTITPGGTTFGNAFGPGGRTDTKDSIAVVQVRELWMKGPRGTCSRYIVCSGDTVFLDVDFSNTEKYCPIGFARFYDNNTFHGMGLFDLLFSLSRQMELLLKSLFNNIRDIDRYGYLVMPSGSWNERAAHKEIAKGLKVVPWEPDPISENFNPFSVQPYNAGDVPGRTAAFATDMIDRLSPWRDLLEDKGRVDSASGLAFLNEQIQRASVVATRGINRAFAEMYQSLAGNTKDKLIVSPRPLPVGKLTLDMAGAVIDPERSTVSFPENPLPTISRLRFKVAEESPRSGLARKEEALRLVELGVSSPERLMILAAKEGLDFATWNDDVLNAYESLVQNILILYGDGETPGQIHETELTVLPDIQLMGLDAFIVGPFLKQASVEVVNEFQAYKEFLLEQQQVMLPEQVPALEDTIPQEGVGNAVQ